METEQQAVEESAPKTREDMINYYLSKYPPEFHPDWYKANLPDVYLGWLYAKKTQPVIPPSETKKEWKKIAVILGVLGAFALITIFLIFYFFGEAVALFLPS